ncbi:uncharacterized protein PG998_015171 [Apiospora kogelbergensis]|uniref:uncharacterized protein n=1 Tax=Apiospora kogelbergensis TaxID=1337665 RepID=UPI00312EAE08
MNRADRRALEESQEVVGGRVLGRTRSTRNRAPNNPEPGDETPGGEIPIAIEVSEGDVSMRSHTTTEADDEPFGQTTSEAPPDPEPLGHAETEARHTDSFPDTPSVDLQNEVDEFATDDGPSTHGTQPANILSVRGRLFYQNFRCPQTHTIETARIEGSPPWKSFVLLTLPPFSRGQPRRGYTCKKEQLGIRSSRFTALRMLTAQLLRDYIRDHGIPGIHWICPYVDLELDDDRVNNPQRNTYSWMKLEGPDPSFISRGVWNSVLRSEGQGRIDAHYAATGQDPPSSRIHPRLEPASKPMVRGSEARRLGNLGQGTSAESRHPRNLINQKHRGDCHRLRRLRKASSLARQSKELTDNDLEAKHEPG